MKRKGFILWEALMGLLLISCVVAATLPLVHGGIAYVDRKSRDHLQEDVVMEVWSSVTERLRNSLTDDRSEVSGNRVNFTWYDQNGNERSFAFLVSDRKLKLLLYTGMTESITGEEADGFAGYYLYPKDRFFTRNHLGLVTISYKVVRGNNDWTVEAETSILPYATYYQKGAIYE